ncbi:hypothetical protein Tco_1453085 [Tanacetum coccineum]
MVFNQGRYGGQDMTQLPPRDQRHPWLGYQVEGYTEDIIHNYEQRLEMIFGRSFNRVHILDFAGLTEGMRQTLAGRMSDTEMGLDVADTLCFQLGGARQDGFEAYWLGSERVIPNKGDLRDYWIKIYLDKDFLGPTPSYVYIRDPVRKLCHMMISYSISGKRQAPEKVTGTDLFYIRSMDQGTSIIPYLLAHYLFKHVEWRKSGARLSGEHFIGRLATHFGLVSDEELRGLSVITRELPMIDLHELVRLNIYKRLSNTWAWVAPGLERQLDAATSARKATRDALAVDEGAPADPAPMQAPQPPHLAP